MHTRILAIALFAVLCCAGSWPDEPTPVVGPAVLTDPGRYRLAVDIDHSGIPGDAIVIEADDVTFDLDGHRIVERFGDAAIRVHGRAVEVRNGTLVGPFGGTKLLLLSDAERPRMRRLHLIDGGIHGTVIGEVELTDSVFDAPLFDCLQWRGVDGATYAPQIHRNRFSCSGIVGQDLRGVEGGAIVGNKFAPRSSRVVGLSIIGSGTRIESNEWTTFDPGIRLLGSDFRFLNNRMSLNGPSGAMITRVERSEFRDNVVEQSGEGYVWLMFEPTDCVIAGNLLTGESRLALDFDGDGGGGNLIEGNLFIRRDGGPAIDVDFNANTDGGGNRCRPEPCR